METEMVYTEPETEPLGGGQSEIQETNQPSVDYQENFNEIEQLLSQIRDALTESETESVTETNTETITDNPVIAGNTINLVSTVLLSAILALLVAAVVFRRM